MAGGGTPEGTDLPGGSEESIAATHRVVIGLESKFSSQPAPENAMNQPCKRTAWNSGKLVGQKAPLKLKEIWAIRFRLQLAGDIRKLAPFRLSHR